MKNTFVTSRYYSFIAVTVFVLFCFGLLSACANKQYKFEYVLPTSISTIKDTNRDNNKTQQATTKIVEKKREWVWPLTPEIPRYRYLGDITGEENFSEIENSVGRFTQGVSWLGQLIFGEEPTLRLHRPQSGVFDNKNNRLFVTDVGQKNVFVFDLKNNQVETWEGGDEKSFISPIAVSILASGHVLVSDAELGAVLHFDTKGKYLGLFGVDSNNGLKDDVKTKYLYRPTGIAYDQGANKVFVADSQTHQIQVFDGFGKWLFAFGKKGHANGEFNSPTHLAFANNILHVSDTLNARVQMFDANGKWLRTFGRRGLNVGDMPRPKGIALDSDDNIYVVESYYDYLLMFNQQGQGLMALGGTGSAPGKFDLPAGVWVDETDKVYVADMFNQRISVFQYLSVSHKNEIEK